MNFRTQCAGTRRNRYLLPSQLLPVLLAVLQIFSCSDGRQRGHVDELDSRLVSLQVITDDFGGIAGAVRLSDGTVVVADNGRHQLRRYDTTSNEGAAFGRKGRGPGEFTGIHRLRLCGDTLVAYDYGEARLSLFSEHAYVRQVQLPVALTGADLVGCANTDSLFFSQTPEQIPGFGTQIVPLTLFRLSLWTNQVEWLTSVRGSEMHVSKQHRAFYERPFGLRSLMSAGPGGLVVAETNQPVLHTILPDRERFSIALPAYEPRKITSLDRSDYLAERLQEEVDTTIRATIRGVLGEAEWGTHAPIFDRLFVTNTGTVMVRLYPLPQDSLATWLMIPRDSPVKERVRLPRSARVLFADAAGILVVAEADDGSERIEHLVFDRGK